MKRRVVSLASLASLSLACTNPDSVPSDAAVAEAPEVTPTDRGPAVVAQPDEHPPCDRRNPLREPYFGDLHVHTQLSFDAIAYDIRSGPDEAYAFARGESIGLPPYDAAGTPSRRVRLARPLDFAAVTDHSEYLAETALCHDPSSPAYASRTCVTYRNAEGVITPLSLGLAGFYNNARPPVCSGIPAEACPNTFDRIWQGVQDAAERAYDRTSACRFTSFVGYEWSGSPGGSNAHRNVIFRNRTVPRSPASFFEATTAERLWAWIQSVCLDSGTGCDALAIPHNGNLGAGRMFVPVNDSGAMYTREESTRRARIEPVAEIYQHKGASECLRGRGDPLASEDERCDFEALTPPLCAGTPDDPPGCTPVCTASASATFTGTCSHPRDFLRGALRTGLREWQRTGADPFHLGVIASTDTHSATAGATDESTWEGHTGLADGTPERRLHAPPRGTPTVSTVTSSPGGLAVVWAEENSRPALFDALRRRETYGTSGTRILVRFFGGWSYPDALCADPELVRVGYRDGVAMGGDLPARPDGARAPGFVLSALRDAMSAPLSRVQIVKAWVTGDTTRERVYDVATSAAGDASVDLATCTPRGTGADSLCGVWRDPEFDPAVPAVYYARVIENPTCRWSRRLCNAQRVDCATLTPDSPWRACCGGTVADTVEERAWTSPIWYLPPRP